MARWPWRRQTVPDQVKAALDLRPGERVLAACRSGETDHLVATDRALYAVTGARTTRWRWDLIDQARWQPPDLVVDVRSDSESTVQRRTLPADPQGDLPAVVRDRVTNSIVVNNAVAVPGGTVRVVARRNSDDGCFEWRTVPGGSVSLADPAVAQAVDAELRSLRAQFEA